MNTIDIEVVELAKEMGFENWIDVESKNRGWYTCSITGAKFRGQVAEDMIAQQEIAITERQGEIETNEESEQMSAGLLATVTADIEMEEQMDAELEAFGEIESTEKKEARQGMVRTITPRMMEEEVVPFNEHITERLVDHVQVQMLVGKAVKLTAIKCEDCGAEREIKVQDAFQVTRCPGCQKKHRNRKRAERRRQQRAEAKANESAE